MNPNSTNATVAAPKMLASHILSVMVFCLIIPIQMKGNKKMYSSQNRDAIISMAPDPNEDTTGFCRRYSEYSLSMAMIVNMLEMLDDTNCCELTLEPIRKK